MAHDTVSDRADQIGGVGAIKAQSRLEDTALVPTILMAGIETVPGELGPLDHRATASGVQSAGGSAAGIEPLAWLNERLALEIKAPDLSEVGFALVGKSRVGLSDDGSVQLVYRDQQGTQLSLFLRPRWEERSNPREVMRSDGIAVHYWLDGPLAFALASNAQDADTERLAQAVHAAVGRSRLTDPAARQTVSERIPPLPDLGLEAGGMPTLSSEPVPGQSHDPGVPPQFN